jgi:hypothetical protein
MHEDRARFAVPHGELEGSANVTGAPLECQRVPKEGLEPSRPFGRRILSPLRLPFRHFGSVSAWRTYRDKLTDASQSLEAGDDLFLEGSWRADPGIRRSVLNRLNGALARVALAW